MATKNILALQSDGSYYWRGSDLVTWHIKKWYSILHEKWIYDTERLSGDPEFQITGRKVAKIPDFLKSTIFELQRKI